MKTATYAKNLRPYKNKFALIVGQIFAFALSGNLVCESKNLSPCFKWTA